MPTGWSHRQLAICVAVVGVCHVFAHGKSMLALEMSFECMGCHCLAVRETCFPGAKARMVPSCFHLACLVLCSYRVVVAVAVMFQHAHMS